MGPEEGCRDREILGHRCLEPGPLFRQGVWPAEIAPGSTSVQHAAEAMVVRVPAVGRVEGPLRPPAGVRRAGEGPTPQGPLGRPCWPVRPGRRLAGTPRVVVRVVPIGAPLANLAGQAEHSAPAAITGVPLRRGRPVELRHVLAQPAGPSERAVVSPAAAAVEPQPPLIVVGERAAGQLICAAAGTGLQLVTPWKDAAAAYSHSASVGNLAPAHRQ
jgi:hypothetical protein